MPRPGATPPSRCSAPLRSRPEAPSPSRPAAPRLQEREHPRRQDRQSRRRHIRQPSVPSLEAGALRDEAPVCAPSPSCTKTLTGAPARARTRGRGYERFRGVFWDGVDFPRSVVARDCREQRHSHDARRHAVGGRPRRQAGLGHRGLRLQCRHPGGGTRAGEMGGYPLRGPQVIGGGTSAPISARGLVGTCAVANSRSGGAPPGISHCGAGWQKGGSWPQKSRCHRKAVASVEGSRRAARRRGVF